MQALQLDLLDLTPADLGWNTDLSEGDREYAAWLDRAIFLQPNRQSKKLEIAAATAALCKLLDLGPRSKDLKKQGLNCVLSNYYLAHSLNRPLRYSRKPNDYTAIMRHNWPHFTARIILSIIDRLKELGLIHTAKGYYDRGLRKGCQSRTWATDKLVRLFESLRPVDIEHLPRRDPLVLRQRLACGRKKEVLYKDNSFTHAMRVQLERYNQLIERANVSLSLTYEDYRRLSSVSKGICMALARGYHLDKEMRDLLETVEDQQTTDEILWRDLVCSTFYSETETKNCTAPCCLPASLKEQEDNQSTTPHCSQFLSWDSSWVSITVNVRVRNLRLHRVFNVLSPPSKGRFSKSYWTLGGRFYGPEVQLFPGELRRHLTLNGEAVAEPDFSAMYLRMLYHRRGLEVPSKLYDSPYDFGKGKKLNKLAVLIVVNCEPGKDPVKAIRQAFREDWNLMDKYGNEILKKAFIEELIADFRKAHPAIEQDFFSGKGLEFQNLDSMITSDILDYFLDREIPVLPIHDSYIVARQYGDDLYEVMKEKYRKYMGFDPVIHA